MWDLRSASIAIQQVCHVGETTPARDAIETHPFRFRVMRNDL